MTKRSELSAADIDELYRALEGRLEGVGVETQPEIAAKVIKLVGDPEAGLREYSAVVKLDPALSGRLLRLANSAFFAQRQPVTNLDRACVLLGLERLKAIALGFQLSRASGAVRDDGLARKVWGEGVYRACLCAELARRICPGYSSEAFVIGLMLDCGVPLLSRLLGPSAMEVAAADDPPSKRFKAEFHTLAFTHVDIATALVRRWRLPDLLAKPIERHHAMPFLGGKPEPIHLLHRVAYYVGAVHLLPAGDAPKGAPLPATAERVLGLGPAELTDIVGRAAREYGVMSEMFREMASSIDDVASLAESVQGQLVELMDRSLIDQLRVQTGPAEASFVVAQQKIDVEMGSEGIAVAYLLDGEGVRLLSYAFKPGKETVRGILDALGLDDAKDAEAAALGDYVRSLAA
jgi:HD-like signal output (HDOD) protein